jgi:hypothetical protein
MGWSFRKSTSFGPFRLNLSSSGLGLSFGVKGARISMNKRGTFVNLGTNGIYYRQRIGGNAPRQENNLTPVPDFPGEQSEALHTITTNNVETVTDVNSQAFVDELESKASRISLLKWFGFWPCLIFFLYVLSFANDVVSENIAYKEIFTISKKHVFVRSQATKESLSISKAVHGDKFVIAEDDSSQWVKVYLDQTKILTGFIHRDMGTRSREVAKTTAITRAQQQPWLPYGYYLLAILMIGWCFYLRHIDHKRKTIEIYYTLDDHITELHKQFLQYFQDFASSKRIWQTLHVTATYDKKYHAGASQLVSRVAIGGIYTHRVPSSLMKTNVSIPCIVLKNTELYFFPERLIVKRGNKFGAVFYKNISIEQSQSNFIESESLPSDAVVVDHTWKYLNKSGGPDRRFNDNRRLPVCRYSEYTFKSDGGLFEVMMTSKIGAMDQFAEFLEIIGEYQKRMN